MSLEAIEPRRLYRQVAEQLRAYIEHASLAVGTRLPTERDLAEKLNVSRPTIREALIALEVEGRVRIRVGSGIYVSEPPAPQSPRPEGEGAFELLAARGFLEGAIAAEAALKATPRKLAEIDGILARMAQAEQPSDEAVALDRAFHVAVASILGNAVITRFVGEIFDQRMSPYFGRLASYFETRDSWLAATAEHRAIRDALAAKDPTRAREALQRHLKRSAERFSISFGEGEAGDERLHQPAAPRIRAL